jgi:allophanate hydrolase subunit 2
MLRYHVAFYLPRTPAEMVVAEALDFPGAERELIEIHTADVRDVGLHDVRVLEAGLLTTIQDLGRFGHQRVGVPPSGPMDRAAFLVANRLVGNPDVAAGLECTIKGPRLEVRQAAVVAVTGAPMGFTVNGQEAPSWTAVGVRPGDVLGFQMASAGCRAYLAVAGGIDVPLALGSRATYLRGRLGGLGGRLDGGRGLAPCRRPCSAAATHPPAVLQDQASQPGRMRFLAA